MKRLSYSFLLKASFLGIKERGINGICSQFCSAAPRGQFCRAGQGLFFAGRGSLFFHGAGRGGATIPDSYPT